MLASWLERLLRNNLGEFVDLGDDVNLSLYRGNLYLRNLLVKKKALAFLGYEGGRVREGHIGKLEIKVPLRDLVYSGKLEIIIENVYLEFEHVSDQSARKSDKEVVEEMMKDHQKLIDVTVKRYHEFLMNKDTYGHKEGFRYRLYRKILHNFKVRVSDVTIVGVSKRAGLAGELKMQELVIYSTDDKFTMHDDFQASDRAMYKLVRLTQMGFRMSLPDVSTIEDAEHIVTPFSAELKITHQNPQLKFRLEVATKEYAGLVLRRSQVKRLRKIMAENSLYWQHIREYVVSEEEEAWIMQDATAKDKYRELYTRKLLDDREDGRLDRRLDGIKDPEIAELVEEMRDRPLSEGEERHKLKLELVIPIRTIARLQCLVNEELAGFGIPCKALESNKSIRSDFSKRIRTNSSAAAEGVTRLATTRNLDTLTEDEEISKFLDEFEELEDSVQMPTEFIVEFELGKLAFDMVDDRWYNEVRRNAMSVSAERALISVQVKTGETADETKWQCTISLTAFNALHASEVFISFAPPAAASLNSGTDSTTGIFSRRLIQLREDGSKELWKKPSRQLTVVDLERNVSSGACVSNDDTEDLLHAFSMTIGMFDVDPGVLTLNCDFEPVEVEFIPGVLDQIVDFLEAPYVQVPQKPFPQASELSFGGPTATQDKTEFYIQDALDTAKEWVPDAKELAQQMYAAIPLKLDLNLNFASPIVQVPVEGMYGSGPLGTAVFTLGELTVKMREPCIFSDLDLDIELRNAEVRAETIRGERFDMIQPTLVNLKVKYKYTDDGHFVEVALSWERMVASMSPQALQVFFSMPFSLLAVMYQKYEDEPDQEDPDSCSATKFTKETFTFETIMHDITEGLSRFTDVVHLERLADRVIRCASHRDYAGFEQALALWLECLHRTGGTHDHHHEALEELKEAVSSLRHHRTSDNLLLNDQMQRFLSDTELMLDADLATPQDDDDDHRFEPERSRSLPAVLHAAQAADFSEENAEHDDDVPRTQISFRSRSIAFARDIGADEVVEAAQAHVQAAASKPFHLTFTLAFEETELTLSDSIDPVMRFHGEMRSPGLVMYFINSPKQCTLDISDGVLEWDYLNLRTGVWEPFGERFHLNLHLAFKVAENQSRQLNLVVSGRQPLLLNLKPSAVQRIGGMLPEFGEALSMTPALKASDNHTALEDKYRLMNLAGVPVELEFRSKPDLIHGVETRTKIADHKLAEGHRWTSVTPLVLDIFATSVRVRAKDVEELEFTLHDDTVIKMKREKLGKKDVINQYMNGELELEDMKIFSVNEDDRTYQDKFGWAYFRADQNLSEIVYLRNELFSERKNLGWSDPLQLERAGVVAVPGTGLVVELLVPDVTHRLLLVTTPLRVHNKTDLTLSVKFHKGSVPLALNLDKSCVCDAFYLNNKVREELVLSAYEEKMPDSRGESDAIENGLRLPPNAVCAVPMAALEFVNDKPRTALSVKMAWVDVDFCAPIVAGMGWEPRTLLCPSYDRCTAAQHDLHLICESVISEEVSLMPDSVDSMKLTTIALRPTLALRNALPTGTITVGVAIAEADRRHTPATWYEGKVPKLACLNLYNFPGVLRKSLYVRAMLGNSKLWSAPVHFSHEAYKDAYSGQTIQLKPFKDGAAAGISVEAHTRYMLRFSCPNWFLDRSGLPQQVRVLSRGRPLPLGDNGITLLPAECYEERCELVLCSATGGEAGRKDVHFHPDFCVLPWATQQGHRVFCVQRDEVNPDDVLGAQCSVMTLRPRLVLTNSESCGLELDFGEGTEAGGRPVELAAGRSLEVHWQVSSGEESPSTSLRFRPGGEHKCQWSGKVVCGDRTAGSTPFLLSRPDGGFDVWTVEVAPVRGSLAVSFRKGSDFVVVNKVSASRIKLCICPCGGKNSSGGSRLKIPAGDQELPYGWYQPHEEDHRRAIKVWIIGNRRRAGQSKNPIREVLIDDVRAATDKRVTVGRFSFAIEMRRHSSKNVLVVEECQDLLVSDHEDKTGYRSLEVELKLSKLGLSIISEDPKPQEILFVQFDLFRFAWRRDVSPDDDVQQLGLAISEVHVDCQLPGRVDALTSDHRRDKSLGLLRQERPVVIFANHGTGKNAFFEVNLKKKYTSAQDLLFPLLEFSLDEVDVTIDDDWISAMVEWVNQCTQGQDSSATSGVPLNQIIRTAGKSITEGYQSPALPALISIDVLRLSRIQVTAWCCLKLMNMNFIPLMWKRAIGLISFSRELRLDGATLSLDPRSFFSHCGSAQDFGRLLALEYRNGFLSSAASALGKSSVLRLPRAPVKLGGTAISHLTEGLGLVAGETASLLDRLTFDDEYVSRQRQVRSNKHIKGINDGMAEAGKSLAEGVEGMLDIFTKPMEGMKEGLPGFAEGVGMGVLGTFVKPISGLGQAVSDVGAGIAAQVSPDTASAKRRRARIRQRLPRLLFGKRGAVHPWSQVEAELLHQLGHHTNGIEEWFEYEDEEDGSCKVYLLFPTKLMVAELAKFERSLKKPRRHRRNSSSSTHRGLLTTITEDGDRSSAAPHDSSTDFLTGTSPAASSSARPAPARGSGFIEATQEAAERLVAHGSKPLNTLLYAYEDLGGSQEVHTSGDPKVIRGIRVLKFANIAKAEIPKDGPQDFLLLTGHGGHSAATHRLHLRRGDRSAHAKQLRQAFLRGVTSALESHKRMASWEELQLVLRQERRMDSDKHLEAELETGRSEGLFESEVGQRILEVFEVERRAPTGKWVTPWLPSDREFSYRWVDALGWRHPHLKHDAEGRDLTREEIATSPEPPVELEHLFQGTSNWKFDIVERKTDKEGWRYAIAWCSSTWDPEPGLFNMLRKRRWYRTYV